MNNYNNVYRLSLSPSIKRSAAIIKDAYIAITPDTSILHMASAYNTPLLQFMLITNAMARNGRCFGVSRRWAKN